MPASRKVDVALAPDLAPLLDDAVASGEFSNESDVVNDALRLWRHTRQASQLDVETLRRLWREGLNSGASIEAEPEFRRLREKYADAETRG